MSVIPGIASSHDASACVPRDGVLPAAVSEERMSRIKCDGGRLPRRVRRDRNPRYRALIERYRQLSGIPLVLNTSFNVHEEPIVRGPHEAVQALVDRRIDQLAIGDFWVPGVAGHP